MDAASDEFVLSRSTYLLKLALLLAGWNEAVGQEPAKAGAARQDAARQAAGETTGGAGDRHD